MKNLFNQTRPVSPVLVMFWGIEEIVSNIAKDKTNPKWARRIYLEEIIKLCNKEIEKLNEESE